MRVLVGALLSADGTGEGIEEGEGAEARKHLRADTVEDAKIGGSYSSYGPGLAMADMVVHVSEEGISWVPSLRARQSPAPPWSIEIPSGHFVVW